MKIEVLLKKAEELLLSLEEDVKKKQKYVDKAPEGKLAISKTRSGTEWRVRTLSDKVGKKWEYRYLRKKERKLAKQLAVKEYYLRSIQDDMSLIIGLKLFLAHTKVKDKAISLLNQTGYYDLLGDVVLSRKEQAFQMIKEYHTDENYRKSERTVKTVAGFCVRSKSERSIVNLLIKNGIAFVYEPLLMIGGEEIHPDFLIVHPVTLELVIWEHYGKIDKPNYRGTNLRRLDKYIEDGYIPDKNLIITWETEGYPIDEADIQMKIEMLLS